MNIPYEGCLVKFRDDLWEEKKLLGSKGGLFGPPLKENTENKFRVLSIINQGTLENPDYELKLDGYPWLVYFDEMEIIE